MCLIASLDLSQTRAILLYIKNLFTLIEIDSFELFLDIFILMLQRIIQSYPLNGLDFPT